MQWCHWSIWLVILPLVKQTFPLDTGDETEVDTGPVFASIILSMSRRFSDWLQHWLQSHNHPPSLISPWSDTDHSKYCHMGLHTNMGIKIHQKKITKFHSQEWALISQEFVQLLRFQKQEWTLHWRDMWAATTRKLPVCFNFTMSVIKIMELNNTSHGHWRHLGEAVHWRIMVYLQLISERE